MSNCPNVHVVHFIEGGWRWGGFLSSLCSPSFSFSALRSSSHKLDVLLVDALIHREATELTTAGDDVARVELGSHVCGSRSRGFCQNSTQIVLEHDDGISYKATCPLTDMSITLQNRVVSKRII